IGHRLRLEHTSPRVVVLHRIARELARILRDTHEHSSPIVIFGATILAAPSPNVNVRVILRKKRYRRISAGWDLTSVAPMSPRGPRPDSPVFEGYISLVGT